MIELLIRALERFRPSPAPRVDLVHMTTPMGRMMICLDCDRTFDAFLMVQWCPWCASRSVIPFPWLRENGVHQPALPWKYATLHKAS